MRQGFHPGLELSEPKNLAPKMSSIKIFCALNTNESKFTYPDEPLDEINLAQSLVIVILLHHVYSNNYLWGTRALNFILSEENRGQHYRFKLEQE